MFDILYGDYVESVEKLYKEGKKFQLILVNQKKNVGFLEKLYDTFEKVLDNDSTVFLYSNSEMLEVLIQHATKQGDDVLTVFDTNNEVAKACFNDRKVKEMEFSELLKGGDDKREEKNHDLLLF